ncbi:MAG TPA: hypothetical protein VED41_10570 [Solirubrobacteraceae bacterium]|nr:hypothetical protein [Solirubrobacteraceae bacterium]
MSEIVYTHADAFLEDQACELGPRRDWRPHQWITLELADEDASQLGPALCALTSSEARELALRLLALAEHADRRARGEEPVG